MLLRETAAYRVADNGMYYLEVVGSHVLTNDNYVGLLVLDDDLSPVERMRLYADVTIYSSFADDLRNVVVLYCPDSDRLVYVDLWRGTQAEIAIKDKLRQEVLSDVYAWVPNGLIVSTYGGAFYYVDLPRCKIDPMPATDVASELPTFYEFWMQSAYDPRRREAISGEQLYVTVEEDRRLVHAYDHRRNQWHTAHTGEYWPHEVRFREGTFLLVHEQQVAVREVGGDGAVLASAPHWRFMRGRFMPGEHADRIVVLSGDDRDSQSSAIVVCDIVR